MTALIKDPVLSLSYGPSGIGKTTDTGLSFPNALFIAAPGALQSIRNVAGYDPLVENASTLLDVTKARLQGRGVQGEGRRREH